MKPMIGVLAHPSDSKSLIHPYNFIGRYYTDSIQKAGGIPIIIPIIDDEEVIASTIDAIDGLLIPGGMDLNPLSYHEDPMDKLGTTDISFDQWEYHFISKAKEKKIPILGICRGHQILNAYHGGTLYQDLSYRNEKTFLHAQKEASRSAVWHCVHFEEGSKLFELFGKELYVNSFHHQAVKDLAPNFRVTAKANDGVVEAIEDTTDYPYMIGVQWHPEGFVKDSDIMMPLFNDFIENCKK